MTTTVRYYPAHIARVDTGPGSVEKCEGRRTASGHERNMLSLPCGDLPVGHFCVESPLQKYFTSPVGQIISTNSRCLTHRGAYRDRHGRGMGCGGRGSVLRAKGLQGGFFESVSDQRAGGREMLQRTAKSCGPDAPTL